jgi:hypothetical protein
MNLNSIQTRTRQQMDASHPTRSRALSRPSTPSAIHASVHHALAWFGLGVAGMSCGGDLNYDSTSSTHY